MGTEGDGGDASAEAPGGLEEEDVGEAGAVDEALQGAQPRQPPAHDTHLHPHFTLDPLTVNRTPRQRPTNLNFN